MTVTEGRYAALDNTLVTAMCPAPLPAAGFCEEKQTGYVARMLAVAEWQALIDHFHTTPSPSNVMMISRPGARFRRSRRRRPCSCTAMCRWTRSSRRSVTRDQSCARDRLARRGPRSLRRAGQRPRLSELSAARPCTTISWRYWGENFETLLWVKRKFDPENVFRFEQGISPLPDDVHDDCGRVLFSDPGHYVWVPGR